MIITPENTFNPNPTPNSKPSSLIYVIIPVITAIVIGVIVYQVLKRNQTEDYENE